MELNKKRFTVAAAVDLSDFSVIVLERAFDEALRRKSSTVIVVSVVPMRGGLLSRHTPGNGELDEAQERLEALVRESATSFDRNERDVRVQLQVRVGHPAEEITELAEEARADLLVIGRHGWGQRRGRFVGSTCERVGRAAPCCVLMVQPSDYTDAAAEAACDACVEVRAQSGGETWFCPDHTDHERGRHLLFPLSGGGLGIDPGHGMF